MYINSPGGSGTDSYFLRSFLGPGSISAITSWSLHGLLKDIIISFTLFSVKSISLSTNTLYQQDVTK